MACNVEVTVAPNAEVSGLERMSECGRMFEQVDVTSKTRVKPPLTLVWSYRTPGSGAKTHSAALIVLVVADSHPN